MIQNHNIQGHQERNLTSDKQRNSVIRTFQMLLTAIAMLFTLGVQGIEVIENRGGL